MLNFDSKKQTDFGIVKIVSINCMFWLFLIMTILFIGEPDIHDKIVGILDSVSVFLQK